ncbi:SHOCT domain-containing protein [Halapricum sp. CBA1109]|uniref:SHOCT domain-containing protein n=1 Tax=Halapricum sp. CBA1109 TaxID=2668068 RepID=UPI0012F72673|nr:SHOCT domain-containing protein [Halapricum sp. CBA1109]MUV91024.1 SHOCT domain-containing protein [Halapricum sp. CBA1109]
MTPDDSVLSRLARRVTLSTVAVLVVASGTAAAHGSGMGGGAMGGGMAGGGLYGGLLWMGLWLAVPVLLAVAVIRALDGRRRADRPRDRRESDARRERPD